MYHPGTVLLSGNLSDKWLAPEAVSDRNTFVRLGSLSPSDVLAHSVRVSPCILVVDMRFMDEVDSDEFCSVVDFGSSIRVLVEVEEARLAETERLLRTGCAGCLRTDAPPTEAWAAIQAVQSGELWGSRILLSSVLRSVLRETKHELTSREGQIFSMVSGGLKNSEIADRLCISEQTVRWHLRGLYRKLGRHDRLRAVTKLPSEGGNHSHTGTAGAS